MASPLSRAKEKLARMTKGLRAARKKDAALHKDIHRREDQITAQKKRIWRIRHRPLRLKAYDQAKLLIGVVEQGGNNTGPVVDKIIRANGGLIGEPWCGDFVAFCYRLAGSKAVTRSWASVRMLGAVTGVRKTSAPKTGDLVRYNFDHVGMFEKDNGDGTITAIEGNTGSSGAVSDSHAGTDGVKRKVRAKSLVNDYLRVTR